MRYYCLVLAAICVVSTGCDALTSRTPLEEGQRYFQEKQLDQAVEALNRALAEDPSSVEALVLRGRIYKQQGEADAALADFSEAIRLDPEDCDTYYYRAEVYKALGDEEKFNADRAIALRLDPDRKTAYQVEQRDPILSHELATRRETNESAATNQPRADVDPTAPSYDRDVSSGASNHDAAQSRWHDSSTSGDAGSRKSPTLREALDINARYDALGDAKRQEIPSPYANLPDLDQDLPSGVTLPEQHFNPPGSLSSLVPQPASPAPEQTDVEKQGNGAKPPDTRTGRELLSRIPANPFAQPSGADSNGLGANPFSRTGTRQFGQWSGPPEGNGLGQFGEQRSMFGTISAAPQPLPGARANPDPNARIPRVGAPAQSNSPFGATNQPPSATSRDSSESKSASANDPAVEGSPSRFGSMSFVAPDLGSKSPTGATSPAGATSLPTGFPQMGSSAMKAASSLPGNSAFPSLSSFPAGTSPQGSFSELLSRASNSGNPFGSGRTALTSSGGAQADSSGKDALTALAERMAATGISTGSLQGSTSAGPGSGNLFGSPGSYTNFGSLRGSGGNLPGLGKLPTTGTAPSFGPSSKLPTPEDGTSLHRASRFSELFGKAGSQSNIPGGSTGLPTSGSPFKSSGDTVFPMGGGSVFPSSSGGSVFPSSGGSAFPSSGRSSYLPN